MTLLETVSFFMVILGDLPIESFRFEDGFRFARVLKKRHQKELHFTFSSLKMLVRLFILKEVKPSLDSKMVKLHTFNNLFPPLRHYR